MKLWHPIRRSLWIGILLLLLAVFTAEATIMFVLPWVMPTKNSPQFSAFVDATLLTLLLATVLWRLFSRSIAGFPENIASVAHSEIFVGQMLGEYRVLARLGSGGMGEVFKALHVRMKRIDARADVYSLGCSLYFLITGSLIFEGETLVQKILAHQRQPIRFLGNPKTGAEKSLNFIFHKMVQKKPNDRFQSMTELLEDLESWRSDNQLANTRGPSPITQLAELVLTAVEIQARVLPYVLSNISGSEQTATLPAKPNLDTEDSSRFEVSLNEPSYGNARNSTQEWRQ